MEMKNAIFVDWKHTSNLTFSSLLNSFMSLLLHRFTITSACFDRKSYVGKTDNTLFNRTKEHGWKQKDNSVFKHFNNCAGWKDIVTMFQTGGDNEIDVMQFQINAVRENTTIIGRSKNWLNLAFRESLAIKERRPELSKGLKSCKDLALF